MRNACAVVLLLLLAGCSRGNRDRESIRQGVIDRLAGTNLNVAAMDVDITSVQFNGAKADVMVTFRAKGAPGAPGMEMRYQMQQQGDRWVVTGTQDSGHSSQVPPGTANPQGAGGALPPGHPQTGGAAAPSGQGGVMPSPEDLPPVGKK